MNEALEIIRRLWEGETLTFHGKHFHIEGARVSPEPVPKPASSDLGRRFRGGGNPARGAYGEGFIAISEIRSSLRGFMAEAARAGQGSRERTRDRGPCVAGRGERSGQNLARVWRRTLSLPDRSLCQMDGRFGTEFVPHIDSVEELRKSGLLNVATPERAVELIRDYASRTSDRTLLHLDLPAGLSAEKDVRAPGAVCEQGDAAFSTADG